MEDSLDGVISNIRACIVSCKGGGLPVRKLTRDYETLVGGQIPFRRFNHSTVDSFLRSIPSLRVHGNGGDALVEAATDSSSSHITNMIAKQRTSKKASNFPPPRRGGFASRGNRRGRGGGYYPTSRNYSTRESSAPPRRYSPNEFFPPARRDYKENMNEFIPPARRDYKENMNEFIPPARREYKENIPDSRSHEPLTVKVNGTDRRQVSVGGAPSQQRDFRPHKYDLPPRLQRLQNTRKEEPSQIAPLIEENKSTEQSDMYYDDLTADLSIPSTEKISFSPRELIAASIARQEAKNTISFDTSDINIQLQEQELGQYTSHGGFEESNRIPIPVAVPQPDYVDIPRNMVLILQYTMAKGWPEPVYTTKPYKLKGSRTMHIPKVKVLDKFYGGFDDQDADIDVAKGYAAKQALLTLLEEEKVKVVNITKISNDKTIIYDRISEIVAGLQHGMFDKKVEQSYIERYGERLPDGWIDYIDDCPTLTKQSSAGLSYIILPQDATTTPTEPPPKVVPPLLSLSTSSEETFVYVTVATSTACVWFRLIGEEYSEKYEDLSANMSAYYSAMSGELSMIVEEGNYYAAKTEEGWFRVCVCDIKDHLSMVTASLIDQGETEVFNYSQLYRLPDQFCHLPKQAIQCSLDGLEDFSDDETASKIISTSLVGKALIAQVKHKDEDTGNISVVLYDTSGDDDVNLNEMILEQIISKRGTSVLPNEGCAIEVQITSISTTGEVFIVVPNEISSHIAQILGSLGEEEINKRKVSSYRKIVMNKVYLAKYSKDDRWYRAVVTATPSVQQNKIYIQFIDYGNADTITLSDIAELTNLHPSLIYTPPQALKVALHNLPAESLSVHEIAKLNSLLLDDEEKTVLIKTVKLLEDPPVVEIFYKKDDDALVSVNNTIFFSRPDEKTLAQLQQMNMNGHGRLCRGLKIPELDDDYIPFQIELAVSPGSFYFKQSMQANKLESMMRKMQVYYEAVNFPELKPEEVVCGVVCVGKFKGAWYRITVTKEAQSGSSVSVRFCDYGDVNVIPISSLRELHTEFQELPFMAMKGKLFGVAPAHTDWSVEDCLRFKELVEDKVIVGKVRNIKESADPLETVFELYLVDTNSQSDIVISEVLIQELRAVQN